jgi:hypothetical protein
MDLRPEVHVFGSLAGSSGGSVSKRSHGKSSDTARPNERCIDTVRSETGKRELGKDHLFRINENLVGAAGFELATPAPKGEASLPTAPSSVLGF